MTPIHRAILDGNVKKVKKLLESDPNLIHEVDEYNVPMALLAAKTGNLALVRYVVEYSRASMNIYDKKHRGILHYGTMSGNVEVCKYLVEKVGMSPVEGDLDLETPYEIANLLSTQEKEGEPTSNTDYQGILQYFVRVVGVPL